MSKKKKSRRRNAPRSPKRICPVGTAGIETFDYKDIEFLKLFLTEKGKIIPRRISGVCAKNQKKLAHAIKQARNATLISFSEGYIDQNDSIPQQSNFKVGAQKARPKEVTKKENGATTPKIEGSET